MTQFLTDPLFITQWLKEQGIKNYRILVDFSVDVDGDVDILQHMFQPTKTLPVKFRHVTGSFSCRGKSSGYLSSLVGCPQKVGGDFNCTDNKLTSLYGAPKEVGGHFFCGHNHLSSLEFSPHSVAGSFLCHHNQLITLEHAPRRVEGNFNCTHNLLQNLQHCPQTVNGRFNCEHNKIKNLEYCPKLVVHTFHCDHNPLLGDAQYLMGFESIYEIHCQELIKKEKTSLQQTLNSPLVTPPKIHKI